MERVTVKKTNSRELIRTVEESYIEVVERHFGKYTDRRTYGMRLEGNILTIWAEDEDGSRKTLRTVSLTYGEAARTWEDMMRIKNFAHFGTLFFFFLYVDKLIKKR
jgi:hypothetical protein